MTPIKQEENLRFSALIRGEKLFCCSIAEFGFNRAAGYGPNLSRDAFDPYLFESLRFGVDTDRGRMT